VARSCPAVHGFSRGGEAKSLLGRLVGFHLRHRKISAELLPLVEI
jgi:hypothetical protein